MASKSSTVAGLTLTPMAIDDYCADASTSKSSSACCCDGQGGDRWMGRPSSAKAVHIPFITHSHVPSPLNAARSAVSEVDLASCVTSESRLHAKSGTAVAVRSNSRSKQPLFGGACGRCSCAAGIWECRKVCLQRQCCVGARWPAASAGMAASATAAAATPAGAGADGLQGDLCMRFDPSRGRFELVSRVMHTAD